MDVDPPLTDGDYKRAASDMPEKLADESAAQDRSGAVSGEARRGEDGSAGGRLPARTAPSAARTQR